MEQNEMTDGNSTGDPATPPPLSEAEIIAASVGGARLWNGTIQVVPYDPEWPARYEQVARAVRAALGGKVLRLEHAGSTSVPGLAAKPVIDMVLAVADSADEAAYIPPLEAAGFVLTIREPDWFEHRLLKPPEINGNLHVFTEGCEEIETMLLFREWLRAHEEDRRHYEAVKVDLAAREWKYVQNYADAKSEVVCEILTRARQAQSP